MKVLQFIIYLLLIVDFLEFSRGDEGQNLVAMKRPFCNAFTGCGRKRDPAYAVASGTYQLPLPIYRALLHMFRTRSDNTRMKQQLGQSSLALQDQLDTRGSDVY